METKISEIKFNKKFIEKLLSKLKTGNSRSIHLNALPGNRVTRLDLHRFNQIEKDLGKSFLDTILSEQSFNFEINYNNLKLEESDEAEKKKLALLTRKLDNICIENEDSYLEFGIKNFSFGYPVLIKRDNSDPSKIIKAPIFIWNLDIRREYNRKNTWVISRDENSEVKINEVLKSHLLKDESISLDDIPKEFLEDGVIDKGELLDVCNSILKKLNLEKTVSSTGVEKLPDTKIIPDILGDNGYIHMGGIFGIFRSQKQTIIESTEKLLENIDEFNEEDLVLDNFQTSNITSIDTDPSKDEILNTLTKDEFKLIQGPPGTGKSQSITAIISNALANNARCLVVCEKKTALDVIYANLEKAGLDNFAGVIDDVYKDRSVLIKKSRDIEEQVRKAYISFNESGYNTKYKKFDELREKINAKYQESLKKIFGEKKWKDVIGEYLKIKVDAVLVDEFIDEVNEKLYQPEQSIYQENIALIEEAYYLKKELVENPKEVFSLLRTDIFNDDFNISINMNFNKELDAYSGLIKEHSIFLNSLSSDDTNFQNYNIWQTKNFDEIIDSVTKIISDSDYVLSQIESGESISKKEMEKMYGVTDFLLGIKSVYSSDSKELLSIRKSIKLRIKEIFLEKENLESLDYSSNITLEKKSFSSEIISLITDLKNELIASLSVLSQMKENKGIVQKFLKDYLELSFEYFNQENIEISNFDNLESYRELVLKINSDLGVLNQYSSNFEEYYHWKHFLGSQSSEELFLIEKLSNQVDVEKWVDVYKSSYLKNFLIKYEIGSESGFNKSENDLEKLVETLQVLEGEQAKKIRYNWFSRRKKSIARLLEKTSFNLLYNLRKNKSYKKRNSLRKIIETDQELFLDLFPVVLTNPSAVNALFPLQQGMFDIVIFDEASQLRVADTFTSLIRGKYKIIAGDKHQMPPSSYFQSSEAEGEVVSDEGELFGEDEQQELLAESESLLEYAEDLKSVNKSYLDFHYRSSHPALIQFSNSAFYGGNLIPFPAMKEYSPIVFKQVDGLYEDRMNLGEIAEIFNILKDEIHRYPDGSLPSIGIATFNIQQRNAIISALNKYAEEDLDFQQKYFELKEAGLFVKNLENVQGDERDIIILSTTFGVRKDGSFTQMFGRVNRAEGYKLLNVLVTRAKKRVYVCTSIPKEKYLGFADGAAVDGNNKKTIFYAYLAYAKAVSDGDAEQAQLVLNVLKENSFENERFESVDDGFSESPFEEEVYQSLLGHFSDADIIQQYKVGGFRLDFLLQINDLKIVLECDGKAYHSSNEAYAYDVYRQKELENMGLKVYRIWSTNWFQDKEKEISKFLRYIEDLK